MPEIPKIVRQRLRSRVKIESHPDADVLTAFAEQALLPAEREQLLNHLATCEDCRMALVIALPPAESITVQEVAAESRAVPVAGSPKQSWFSRPAFAWPTLRWAALAAGVVVAGALLLHYSENSNPAPLSRQVASEAKPADTATLSSQPKAETTTAAAERDRLANRKSDVVANFETPVSALQKQVVKTKDLESRTDAVVKGKLPASPSPAPTDSLADKSGGRPAAQAVPSRRETVEVTAAAAPVENTQVGAVVTGNQVVSDKNELPLMGRNMATLTTRNEAAPPVTKAKPPTAAEQAAPMRMAASSASQAGAMAKKLDVPQKPARWSLSAGMLRRSFDGGSNWQTVLPDGRLLCYASRETDVWAGGKAGVLLHSTDSGATWSQLHPSIGDRELAGDVSHLEVRSAAEIVLTTSNGETWTTSDNGKTWTSK